MRFRSRPSSAVPDSTASSFLDRLHKPRSASHVVLRERGLRGCRKRGAGYRMLAAQAGADRGVGLTAAGHRTPRTTRSKTVSITHPRMPPYPRLGRRLYHTPAFLSTKHAPAKRAAFFTSDPGTRLADCLRAVESAPHPYRLASRGGTRCWVLSWSARGDVPYTGAGRGVWNAGKVADPGGRRQRGPQHPRAVGRRSASSTAPESSTVLPSSPMRFRDGSQAVVTGVVHDPSARARTAHEQ